MVLLLQAIKADIIMKGKSNLISKFRAAVVGAVSLAIVVSATAVSAFAVDAGKIDVKIGEETSTVSTFA